MDNILEVNKFKKSYGDLNAVNDLSFTVKRGEVFGLIGPNGAGKSTTLECILGTKTSDSGDVKICNMTIKDSRVEIFERVGVQFQDSSYQTGIKVFEICETTSVLYRSSINYIELLKEFDLYRLRKSFVCDLSGGERQKLSILLSCIHSPTLLFLDELTTGLDPIARRQTWKFINRLKKRGTTIILTSHFLDEVEFLCDRACIINKGEMIIQGSVSKIKEFGLSDSLDKAYINIIEGVINEKVLNNN